MNKDIDITGDYRRNRVIELTFNWTADASAGMTALGFRSLHWYELNILTSISPP